MPYLWYRSLRGATQSSNDGALRDRHPNTNFPHPTATLMGTRP